MHLEGETERAARAREEGFFADVKLIDLLVARQTMAELVFLVERQKAPQREFRRAVRNGADPFAVTSSGEHVLFHLLDEGRFDDAAWLAARLYSSARQHFLDRKNSAGVSPLMFRVLAADEEGVDWLLAKGASVGQVPGQWSPAHEAAKAGNVEILQTLLIWSEKNAVHCAARETADSVPLDVVQCATTVSTRVLCERHCRSAEKLCSCHTSQDAKLFNDVILDEAGHPPFWESVWEYMAAGCRLTSFLAWLHK